MNIHDFKSIIEKSAPILADVITPINPLAGMAIGLIAKAFGGDANNLDDLASKIGADPDAAMKLKSIEIENKTSLYQTEVQDRESAREREIDIEKITGKGDWILHFIAVTIVFGYLMMCAFVALTHLDESDHDVLYMMLGQLTGGFIMVLSYYFGSNSK